MDGMTPYIPWVYKVAVDLRPPRQKVSLVSKLGVEGHFDSLDLMTEFDGGAEL